MEEEDELANQLVGEEPVPEEVRDWLTETFTRQNYGKEKPKFRSVANAIRTGIYFDKSFPSLLQIQYSIYTL